MTKTILLSSSGLKNITLNKYKEEEDFIIAFGSQKFRMKSIFAEFISPIISHLHQSDPTIQEIEFNDIISDKKIDFEEFSPNNILTNDIISLFLQISSGYSIEINHDQASKMRFLSILLGNSELFDKLNENFPLNFSEENLTVYLKNIQSFYFISQLSPSFDYVELVNFISKHFHSIDQNEFLKLSRKIQFSIISNPNLQIKNEDSLLDIIIQIISQKEEEEDSEIDDALFLEQIEFTSLSENKLREFLLNFDINSITNSLWRKLFKCFFIHFDKTQERIEGSHSIIQETFEYKENETNQFQGIIDYLTKKCGGNVDEKGVVKVTASSIYKDFVPKNVVDYVDLENFSSLNRENQWILFDFIDKKIRPNYYSIRTHKGDIGRSHLKNWVIEGSNTNNDDDWQILDTRSNENSLNYSYAEYTFKIQNDLGFFRFIRLRQYGANTRNCHSLVLSGLEFFGSISN